MRAWQETLLSALQDACTDSELLGVVSENGK